MTQPVAQHPIVPRERLNFGLDGDIPKYWHGGDPFQTRFWDALSIIFPPGEKFFMNCVRDYRDQITDPKLQQDIKDFNKQEAQHGLVHRQDNDRLRRQGIDVDRLTKYVDDLLDKHYRKEYSRSYTLAITSALEHFTSIIAHSLFDQRDVMKEADPRVRAMYAWHAIEEVEHKGVAYDVMIDYAKTGYFRRVFALMHASLMFPRVIFSIQRQLLIADGFSTLERAKIFAKGMTWLLKPGGLLQPMYKSYLSYYKPGYHPWHESEQRGYEEWLKAFNGSHDPVKASEQMRRDLALA
jgi:predicted metal-dependent hydrolase